MKVFGRILYALLLLQSSALPGAENRPLEHPYLLVTGAPIDGLRSLAEVRRDIQSGRSARLWQEVVAKVEREMREPPIAAGERNRAYPLVATTCNRIMDAALVALIKDDRRNAQSALAQIEALFDGDKWPDWADKAHLQAGLNSDLRHGQFARAIGHAYDWLYQLLTPEERARIVAGLDRCAIQRFKASVAADEKWVRRNSNWKTSVVGGFGILGMGLGNDHPEAAWLREYAEPSMAGYMQVFGPNGEFNETPNYASSTRYLVDYYLAKYYASGGQVKPEQLRQLGAFSHWSLYCILPPARVIAFGDSHPGNPPNISHFSAVASALRDPVIQWAYLRYADSSRTDVRQRSQELLFFDPTLKAEPPNGRLPRARSFPAQAGIVVSHSSWGPDLPASIVYSKSSMEDIHRHADWGQVCLDGFGQRLLVDLGSPPVYPRTGKEFYYNYQQSGHNVPFFGEDEIGISWRERRRGKIVHQIFDDDRGGAWTFDLSEVYGGNRSVQRHVIHLLPRILVVLDEAKLPARGRIRLRWHTAVSTKPDAAGRFRLQNKGVSLAASVTSLGGEATLASRKHEYRPPYDQGRLGNPYPQRHEPFIEVEARSDRFRCLSLFCVNGPQEPLGQWNRTADTWFIKTPEGEVRIGLNERILTAKNPASGQEWTLNLSPLKE
jgi:hypothetical protein